MKNRPLVTIEMENDDCIKVELYPEIAPNTVNNFISLVNKKFYDGLTFHKVVEHLMIQSGDPLGNGLGGPGYCIPGEFIQNGFENMLSHKAGVISMARAIPYSDSAGSQFFIVHEDAFHLDGLYAAFGMVVEGMEVVSRIAAERTDYVDCPMARQVIKHITVETFGINYPEPVFCC